MSAMRKVVSPLLGIVHLQQVYRMRSSRNLHPPLTVLVFDVELFFGDYLGAK